MFSAIEVGAHLATTASGQFTSARWSKKVRKVVGRRVLRRILDKPMNIMTIQRSSGVKLVLDTARAVPAGRNEYGVPVFSVCRGFECLPECSFHSEL